MKTTKFLFMLLLPMLFAQGVKGQGYIPLVDTTKSWSTINNLIDGQFTYWARFKEDTVISGINFRKIFITDTIPYPNHTPRKVLAGFIREDTLNRKVFLMNNSFEEGLIYDFSANQGDTVIIHNGCYYTFSSNIFSYNEVALIVDTVFYSSIIPPFYNSFNHSIPLVDNIARKIIILNAINTLYSYYDVWIEGIGSIYGILESGSYGYGEPRVLLCYSKENNIVYYNPEFNSCVFHSLNITEFSREFRIYPNPSKEYFYIENMNSIGFSGMKIEVLDIFGKVLIHEYINSDITKINVIGLNTGVYFIRIISSKTKSPLYKLLIIE